MAGLYIILFSRGYKGMLFESQTALQAECQGYEERSGLVVVGFFFLISRIDCFFFCTMAVLLGYVEGIFFSFILVWSLFEQIRSVCSYLENLRGF